VTFLTLNISGPSIPRAHRLFDFLGKLDVDVFILTETRPMPGTQYLLDAFRSAGYATTCLNPNSRAERGVAVVHRVGMAEEVACPSVDLDHRLTLLRLHLESPVWLGGIYVPSRDSSPPKISRKRTFLSQTLEILAALESDVILMGDFNVVHRTHVPKYSSFRSWEYDYLERIHDLGLVDVFAKLHPGVQAHSWIGRTGDGYRYDYAFVSQSLEEQVVSCDYLPTSRETGVSDHAGVLMTIGSPAELRDVSLGRQQSLTA
jgi:exodeoxyribonuclease-3